MNLFEIQILKYIHGAISCGALDAVFSAASFLGNSGAIWIIIAAVMLIFPKTRRCGICMSVALIMCLVFGNLLLKPLAARIRPFDVDPSLAVIIKKPTDFSFPSGHTFSSFAGAVTIRHHFHRGGIAALVFACVVAFSRIYLCVHYPSDVLFGAVMGTFLAYVSNIICAKFIFKGEQI